jgi:hypothetical protein
MYFAGKVEKFRYTSFLQWREQLQLPRLQQNYNQALYIVSSRDLMGYVGCLTERPMVHLEQLLYQS